MLEWISVEDRLPKRDLIVLISNIKGVVSPAYRDFNKWNVAYSFECWWHCKICDNITHWMPLPDPPED